MKNKEKKYGILIIRLVVSVIVFMIVFRKVTGEESLNLLSIITLPLLSVIILTGVFQITINSFIQHNLFSIYDFRFSFSKLLTNNFVSTMYLLVIPGFFAPDFYLGYIYGKDRNDYSRVISALFVNRVIGFTTFILLAVIAILILGSSFIEKLNIENEHLNVKLISIIIVSFFGLLILLWLFFKEKLLKIIKKIIQIWNETRNNKKKICYAFFLKLGFNIIGLAGRLGIGYLLGIKIPIWEFACTILILNLLISLPISLNGVGVREAGYVGLLTLIGVQESTALLFALSEFGITLSVALIGAIIFLSMKTNQLIIKLKR